MPPPLQLRFVTSASEVSTLPPTTSEVAFVGRSNVGKSSLVNALANQRQLAKVSKTPGRTQLINLFTLPDGSTFVDLPGYGYSKAPKAVSSTWGAMIEGYLLEREGLRRTLVLVDGEIGPTKLDVAMFEWLRYHDLSYSVVATKHDKVKASTRDKRKRELAEGCEVDPREVTWVSAAKNVNIDLLRTRIDEWLHPDRKAATR